LVGSAPVDRSTYEIAYEAATKAVADQRTRLNDVRSRAATLLSAAAIVTSFIGARALDDQRVLSNGEVVSDRALQGWEIAGIASFVALAALTVAVLMPWHGWTFRLGARNLIRDYTEGPNPATADEMQRDLALHLDNHYERNEARMERLFWAFRIAAVLLAFEVVAWLIDLT
jgi:hypothetical protein